jgi:toxin CcdB
MTRQFDVVANPDPIDGQQRPYLVVLQSDLVSLTSTVVAPLVVHEQMKGAERLNPIMTIEGREYWLATHELFAVDQRVLRHKVGSLVDQHDAIMASLNFLFLGY